MIPITVPLVVMVTSIALVCSMALKMPPVLEISLSQRKILEESLVDLPLIARADAKLDYGIFRGTSALRRLGDKESELLHSGLSKGVVSLLLLGRGYPDAAHEVILGVTGDNTDAAEYAATHPGPGWATKHPLSVADDMIHSLIHRWEGNRQGEGNHTGWNNAKYWAAGGPKQHHVLPEHVVRVHMARFVQRSTPRLVQLGVIASKEFFHEVLADGGTLRNVTVPCGSWDPFRFIDLLANDVSDQEDLSWLQECEFRALLFYELFRYSGKKDGEIVECLADVV